MQQFVTALANFSHIHRSNDRGIRNILVVSVTGIRSLNLSSLEIVTVDTKVFCLCCLSPTATVQLFH